MSQPQSLCKHLVCREDVKKAREEAGTDVTATTIITKIGDCWLGD